MLFKPYRESYTFQEFFLHLNRMTINPHPGGFSEREIFLSALACKTLDDRRAFLSFSCKGDVSLLHRIERLLQEGETVGDFLEKPAFLMDDESRCSKSEAAEKLGTLIGRYKLLKELGDGGCGVVYMAEQQAPVKRRVALKIIKLGMDTRSVIARFEVERQALALMDHPNIARVFDAGATGSGRPFFVMELVCGVKITDFCNQNHFTMPQRLKLFVQVCQAVQHAHQKGIIHRDIKPSNILVSTHDGLPVPKVIDFGIAKATGQRLTEKTLLSERQSFIGTPAYMSPEQAGMSGLDVDTRTDIYALGVLLYELLVGVTPFDARGLAQSGFDECRKTICEREPVRPSTRLLAMGVDDQSARAQQRRTEPAALIHYLQGDLDWIAMKCLEKDRTRRYATASDLAADVQRYLDDEPVLARPPSTLYRFCKFARRNRVPLIAGIIAVLGLLTGATVSTWQAVRATDAERKAQNGQRIEKLLRQQAERERERAQEEKTVARLNEYVADMNVASHSLSSGNLGRAMQLLNKHLPMEGEVDLRGFEWYYLNKLCLGNDHISFPTQDAPIQSVTFSPDGKMLLLGMGNRFNIYDVTSRKRIVSRSKGALGSEFFPDGRRLVTAGLSNVRVWRTADWSEETILRDNFRPVCISSDGAHLATVSWEGVHVWNTSNWREELLLTDTFGPIAISPADSLLATYSGSGIEIWDWNKGKLLRVLEGSSRILMPNLGDFGSGRVMVFSRDGKRLVAPRMGVTERGAFVMSVWNVESGKEIATLPKDPLNVEHTSTIFSMALSPDGTTLASASWDHSVRLWDFATGRRTDVLQGHLNEVWSVAFSPDGKWVASGAKDGGVNLWPMHGEREDDVIAGAWRALEFSPDGRQLAAVNDEGNVVFFNSLTHKPERKIELKSSLENKHVPQFFYNVALSRDFGTLAEALDSGGVRITDLKSGRKTLLETDQGQVWSVDVSHDGHYLLTSAHNHRFDLWHLEDSSTENILTVEAESAVFSPDGRFLAISEYGMPVQLWNISTRTFGLSLENDRSSSGVVAFSQDGNILAVAGNVKQYDNGICLWNTKTGKLLGICSGHKQSVWCIAFSPDGKTMASASDDSMLKIWNVASQQELLSVRRLGTTLTSLKFSPDNRTLVGAVSVFSPQCGLRFFTASRKLPVNSEQ